MTAIRVAGFVRPRESMEVQRITSCMEVANWIHRVSEYHEGQPSA